MLLERVYVDRLAFTCREGHECRVLLEVAVLVQEVLGVEGAGCRPLLVLFEHRVQQGQNHSVLLGQWCLLGRV